jgi:hypothetical protein
MDKRIKDLLNERIAMGNAEVNLGSDPQKPNPISDD